MENSHKLANVFRVLLVIILGICLYFLFSMNESLSEVKKTLVETQKAVAMAKDSLIKLQGCLDTMAKKTEESKSKMADLAEKANQVKTVYINQVKKDQSTIAESDNIAEKMRDNKKRNSNLKW